MKIALIVFAIMMSTLLTQPSLAHCPLCTAATGTAVMVARFYGVNDSIVGLWLGAFIISTALWMDRVINKNENPGLTVLLVFLALGLTIIPFYYAGIVSYHMIFGIDRLTLSILIGAILTLLVLNVAKSLPKKIGYQSIVITLLTLTLVSILFLFWW